MEAGFYVYESELPFKRFLKSTIRASHTPVCGSLDYAFCLPLPYLNEPIYSVFLKHSNAVELDSNNLV